jgi:eukaryotic-like serine/threonine-protein kinase
MTPERWRRVMEVFHPAFDLPPNERDAYLAMACGDDAELRREVESLLAADENAPAILDAEPGAIAQRLVDRRLPDEAAVLTGSHTIGPYRLVRELGRGGMGTVYLAERSDVAKRVALKLVRDRYAAPESVERFLLERRVLARLEHPNIARLLDAGITPDGGTPWFAMEYVEGKHLDLACDDRRLTVEERLALFEQVCEAVQYAHGRLIVHRDLKPSNILVTDSGEVKLLDFGIAKLLGDEATEGLTQTGYGAMTPDYAAPEQFRGEPVTTATDVYALGCVLYLLLTGHRPHGDRRRVSGELERNWTDAAVVRPSVAVGRSDDGKTPEAVSQARATTLPRLERMLAGDLDTIVLKALDPDPGRRYPSAQQLLDDLRHHRAGRPVTARPDTWRYRTRKFVRRNRLGVAALGTFVVLLSGFAVAMTYQQSQTARERDRARLEALKAEQVTEFVTGLFIASNPREARGDAVTARELLERGVVRLDTLRNQPDVRAEMLGVIGWVFNMVGRYDRARPLLEEALAIKRQRHREDHEDVAENLMWLGEVLRARGEDTAAESALREALAIRRRLFGTRHFLIARSLNSLGFLQRNRGDFIEAERTYREALAMERATAATPSHVLNNALNGLGASLFGQGRYPEAEQILREAVTVGRQVLGRDHPELLPNLTNLANTLQEQGDLAGAEPVQREALAGARRVLGEGHPLLGAYAANMGELLRRKGELREAETLFREALAIQRARLPSGHLRIAVSLVGLGQVLTSSGRAAAAEPLLREALNVRQRQIAPDDWRMAEVRSALGACLTVRGRLVEAESLLVESYRALREARGANDARVVETRDRLVALYEALKRPEDARRWGAAR